MIASQIAPLEQSQFGRQALYIVWKSECHRSTMTARAFGVPIAFIAPIGSRGIAATALRYALSSMQTLWMLRTRRPGLIFLLNQPLPLVLIVWAYAKLVGARFILDCHSAPFAWRLGAPRRIYQAATRAAAANLNHNRKDLAAARAAGGAAFLVPEIPLAIDRDLAEPLPPVQPMNVIAVCSFMTDEPIDLLLAAARLLPEYTFYLTGNWRKRASDVAGAPQNVVLLGFLSREKYLAYLAACDVVVTLSKRPHIMQMAAEEALGLGRPLITNHSPILKEVFGDAALYVPLEPQSLAKAIQQAHVRGEELGRMMAARREVRASALRSTIDEVAATVTDRT